MSAKPLTTEQAIEHFTELSRRIQVGAYSELEIDGAFPEDDGTPESTTLKSLYNLEEWAMAQGLEFTWQGSAWSLEPMSNETKAARQAAQESLIHQGECVECERFSSRLSVNGYCEGCVMQAAIDAMEPQERWK